MRVSLTRTRILVCARAVPVLVRVLPVRCGVRSGVRRALLRKSRAPTPFIHLLKGKKRMEEQATTLGKKEFADYLGLAPSYITALIAAGRVVLDGEGRRARVKVAETLAMLESTGGARFDVARRHAAARRSAKNEGEDNAFPRSTGKNASKRDSESRDDERLVDAKTRKESAQADQEEMKAAQMAGNLIHRDDVDAAMKFLGAAVRAAMEVFPDQTAPLVVATTDMNEIHATLTDACRNVLADIGAAIQRQQAALNQGV